MMTQRTTSSPLKTKKWIDRGWYVVLDFGPSRSPQFKIAEQLARSLPAHHEIVDENGEIVYRNTFRQENIVDFLSLFQLVGNWQSCQIYVNGDKVDLTLDPTNGLNCYLTSLESTSGYCRNQPTARTNGLPEYFGCMRSHLCIYHWGWKPWYTFVKRIHENKYAEIDREEMISLAEKNLSSVRFCPLVNLAHTLELIKKLPARIDVDEWPYWNIMNLRSIAPRNSIDYYAYMHQLRPSDPPETTPKINKR